MLVRLWRQHLHEIPSYTDNLPIFREIADGLQKHGIRLNKQEVRRRINSYRNKYLYVSSRIPQVTNVITRFFLPAEANAAASTPIQSTNRNGASTRWCTRSSIPRDLQRTYMWRTRCWRRLLLGPELTCPPCRP